MDVRQLKYFVAIVEHGSLSNAATRLHIAQPALSQHVRHLEEALGVQLLLRNSRGVTTTDAGARLHRHAKRILAQLDDLPDLVREADDSPVGEVRLGMSGTVSELVTVPLIELARGQYPGIRIRPVEAMSGYVLEWLRRDEVDAAIVYATTDPLGVSTQHMLTERLCLFARRGAAPPDGARGGEVPLAATLKLQLITPGRGHGLRDLVDAAASDHRLRLNPAFEIDSYGQIKALSLRGFGYGILPEVAVAREVAQGLLDKWLIVNPFVERKIFIAHRSDKPLSPATAAVVRLSATVLRRLVLQGGWPAALPTGEQGHSDKLWTPSEDAL
jgi:LysR family nitrogen assimilation transcriptional regulator